jgi:ubiquinone/menaquinone biosynthesis C-methylase UbiE
MTGASAAGFYDAPGIAARYDQSRGLPPDVVALWSDLIRKHVPLRPRVTADLGCGTGRFTRILADCFAGTVVGIDPSEEMLRAAAATLAGLPGVRLVRGRAEELPLAPASAELVFMSMSFHHVADQPRALSEIRSVLRPGGALCVRTCSLEALDSYLYQRFFPEARAYDESRFPSRSGLVDLATRAGFARHRFDVVRQRAADNLRQYRDRFATRAHSDLQAISDDQFHEGLKRFDAYRDVNPSHGPVYEDVDFFTFRKSPTAE